MRFKHSFLLLALVSCSTDKSGSETGAGADTPTESDELTSQMDADAQSAITQAESQGWPDTGGALTYHLPYAEGVHMGITQGTTCSGHASLAGSVDFNISGSSYESSNGIDAVAAQSGTVTTSEYNNSGYGNWVIVRHTDGYYTVYAHLATSYVSVGDEVCRGQPLGLIGTTGNSTGDHLHFEKRDSNGSRVTPSFSELPTVPSDCYPCTTSSHTADCYESTNSLECGGSGCSGGIDAALMDGETLYSAGSLTCAGGIEKWSLVVADTTVYSHYPGEESDSYSEYFDLAPYSFDAGSHALGLWVQEIGAEEGELLDSTTITIESVEIDTDGDGDGWTSTDGDCDDTNPDVYPGAEEQCDDIDNDCDDTVDEDVTYATYYPDDDGDGYGDEDDNGEYTCAPDSGHVTNNDDCDDSDQNTYSGASELCDGKDNDCDGQEDENISYATYYPDDDGDGYGDEDDGGEYTCSPDSGHVTNNDDCDDADSDVNPGESEVCDDKDNDCDSSVDEGLKDTYYDDDDGDGYGDEDDRGEETCSPSSSQVTNDDDCDDSDSSVHPGATEECNGEDDDCDGEEDEGAYTIESDPAIDTWTTDFTPSTSCDGCESEDCYSLYRAKVTDIDADNNEAEMCFTKADGGGGPSVDVSYWVVVTEDEPECSERESYTERDDGEWDSSDSELCVTVDIWPSVSSYEDASEGDEKNLFIITGGSDYEDDKIWFQKEFITFTKTCNN